MALRPIDKKVVDAFLDKEAADGRILETDGEKLQTTDSGGSGTVIAKWMDQDHVSVLSEYRNATERVAALHTSRYVPQRWLRRHNQQGVLLTELRTAARKKKAQEERQPGQVAPTLRRRMGDALADLFDEFGPEIFSEVVLSLKDVVLEKFREGFEALDASVKEELGRRGVEESRQHIRPWASMIVEDVNHMGLDEVAAALEDEVNTLTAEYQQPEDDELMEVEDDEIEPVEEVEEEEVEPVEEEAEEGVEEMSMEDLGLEEAPEETEEAAGSFGPTGGRRRHPVPRRTLRKADRGPYDEGPVHWDEEEERLEPDEDDAYIASTGPLYSMYSLSVEGRFVDEFDSLDKAKAALREWTEQNNFYPNLWLVNDHGNIDGPEAY